MQKNPHNWQVRILHKLNLFRGSIPFLRVAVISDNYQENKGRKRTVILQKKQAALKRIWCCLVSIRPRVDRCKGVRPAASTESTSAEAFSKQVTTSSCPRMAAWWRAMRPLVSWRFRADWWQRSCTTAECPFLADSISAEKPLAFCASMWALCCSNTSTTIMWPNSAATSKVSTLAHQMRKLVQQWFVDESSVTKSSLKFVRLARLEKSHGSMG